MRHKVSKVKFRLGQDANQMTLRKMAVNFFANGTLTTTVPRAKMLKSHIDKLVGKSKERTESNRNYLLSALASPKLVDMLFTDVGSAMQDRVGGFVRIEKLHERVSDGSAMAKLVWSSPIVKAAAAPAAEPVEEKAESPKA